MFGLGLSSWVLMLLCFLLLYLPGILYLQSLQKAFARCSPGCRTLSPGKVWLLLIPLFNLIWHFILVTSLAKSLHNEFAKRNLTEAPRPGRDVGVAMCILFVISPIPHLGVVAGIAALVCWIIYWVKITGYSARLQYVGSPSAGTLGSYRGPIEQTAKAREERPPIAWKGPNAVEVVPPPSKDVALGGTFADAALFCPLCNAPNPASAKFCQACGKPIQEARRLCIDCDTINPKGAKYCTHCGKALGELPQIAATLPTESHRLFPNSEMSASECVTQLESLGCQVTREGEKYTIRLPRAGGTGFVHSVEELQWWAMHVASKYGVEIEKPVGQMPSSP